MLTALDHVALAVRDLEGATASIGRLLGRQPSWRGVHPHLGTANALFRLENACLELLAPDRDEGLSAALARRLAERGEGLLALAFATPDAAGCAATWRSRGLAAGDPVAGEGREAHTGAVRRWSSVFLPAESTRGVAIFAIQHRSPPEALPEAAPVASSGSVVIGLDHVVVQSADAEAARALYRDGLGLRLALDRSFEQWGVRLLFFRIGGLTVEVAAPLATQRERGDRDRLWGLSHRVADVAAARERVAKEGFDVSEVRAGRRPGTRVCTVRGEPCGVATLLIGPERPDADVR